jgi:hypothetical protein
MVLSILIGSKPVRRQRLCERSQGFRCSVTSHRSAWSAGLPPLRVLRHTEPLFRPAPPKGRVARRVERPPLDLAR